MGDFGGLQNKNIVNILGLNPALVPNFSTYKNMINPVNKETAGAQKLGRRELFIGVGAAVIAGAFAPFEVLADSYRQAAVKLSEISIDTLVSGSGQVMSERRGVSLGNDYVLSPTQERGKERVQRVLVRIGSDGNARERIRVVRQDGSFEYREGGDTFVFSGFKDTVALARDICDINPCRTEFRDGMNIDLFRVRSGGALEFLKTFPSAFECNPRKERVSDTRITTYQEPRPPTAPSVTPTPVLPGPPGPGAPQIYRSAELPSLQEEFGAVDPIPAYQLGKTIYE